MGYSCSFVDTRSGERLLDLRPVGGRWKTLLNSVGDGSITFDSNNSALEHVSRATWQGLLQPWHRTLVVSYDGVAVYAGLIRDFTSKDGVATVQSREVRALADRRKSSMLISYNPKAPPIQLTGKSLRGIARWVVSTAYVAQPGDNWSLPFVIGGDESGAATFETKINDFESFEDMLTRIQNTDGGPDIAIRPVWSAFGRLQWWLEIGEPRIPGKTFEWSATADVTPVSNFSVSVDGSLQLSGVFALGEGSGMDMKVGRSPLSGITGPPIPDMDGTRSFKSVKTVAELNALATAEIKTFRKPTRSHSFAVDFANEEVPVNLSEFRLGARTRIAHDGDKILDRAVHQGYVTALSGDIGTTSLTVEVQ